MSKFCPNCIETLKEDHKKLGRLSSWLICIKCGFRMRPNDPQPDTHLIQEGERVNNLIDNEDDYYK